MAPTPKGEMSWPRRMGLSAGIVTQTSSGWGNRASNAGIAGRIDIAHRTRRRIGGFAPLRKFLRSAGYISGVSADGGLKSP